MSARTKPQCRQPWRYLSAHEQHANCLERIDREHTPLGANTAAEGGGIYALHSSLMFTGRIDNNRAKERGAGLCAVPSTVTAVTARIGGPGTNEPNGIAPSGGRGVGLNLAVRWPSSVTW